MATKKNYTSKDRTKEIPVIQEPQKTYEDSHYQLHLDAGGIIGKKPAAYQSNQGELKKNIPAKLPKNRALSVKTEPSTGSMRGGISVKLWNFLEWIALSALIFIVAFFAINFGSYSELIQNKLAKMTGNYQVDPYMEGLLETEEKPAQELLPLEKNTVKKEQQLPALDMEVMPPDNRIVIPRINKNVPIVTISSENLIKRDWGALENEIQQALKDGVVHYPGTAEPDENGNVVITGHSSYFPWDPGRFKDVFALLHDVNVGDEIIVFDDQRKYKYSVFEKKVVLPEQIDVLTQEGENRLTLITCTPVGTNLKRLIILAKPVS
jgi:LPXTG-site transpeptidase (sortase) family protein